MGQGQSRRSPRSSASDARLTSDAKTKATEVIQMVLRSPTAARETTAAKDLARLAAKLSMKLDIEQRNKFQKIRNELDLRVMRGVQKNFFQDSNEDLGNKYVGLLIKAATLADRANPKMVVGYRQRIASLKV
jgi:hypothetical protein